MRLSNDARPACNLLTDALWAIAAIAFRSAVSRSASRDPAVHRRENRAAMAARPARWQPALRPCLVCRQPFWSEHAGNRRCKPCRDTLENTGAMALPS